MKQPIKLTQTIRKDGRFYLTTTIKKPASGRTLEVHMKTNSAGQPGNNKTKRETDGLIKGGRGSKRDSDKGVTASVSVAAPASVSQSDDTHGTEDIVFLLRDGQAVCFAATMLGRIQSNYYFESYPRRIFSIHFGESCYYVNSEGKVGGRVHMTRREFWELAKAGNLLQGAAV